MHNRQSGAAHVPIMFFLLLLMMFFGALGFGYVQQTNNAELRQDAADAKAALKEIQDKDLLISDYIEELGNVIKLPGVYEGIARKKEMYGNAKLDYSGMMNPSKVSQLMKDAAVNAGVTRGGLPWHPAQRDDHRDQRRQKASFRQRAGARQGIS